MNRSARCVLAALAVLSAAAAAAPPLAVRSLRTEYLVNPTAVETPAPRLTWLPVSSLNGQKQTAYRILVASRPGLLAEGKADLWDSGRVRSAETANVPYAGRPLAARRRCFWRVRVWDKDGQASPWSETAEWTMGLLAPADWQAEWISHRDTSPLHTSRDTLHLPPARHFRKEFSISAPLRRAVLYGSALGVFDACLNGRPVSNAMFSPGWSDYRQRAYYRAWDVTPLLRNGANAIGAVLADGW